MQLNQVNMSYVALEDRLLLRINTVEGSEFRFWLTRAVVAGMMAGLSRSKGQMVTGETPQVVNPTLRRALEEFDREASRMEPSFAERFEDTASSYPLGQQPLLVVKVQISGGEEHASLAFSLATGQTLTIRLSAGMVASMDRLLHQVLKGVDWNLQATAAKRPVIRLPESETLH